MSIFFKKNQKYEGEGGYLDNNLKKSDNDFGTRSEKNYDEPVPQWYKEISSMPKSVNNEPNTISFKEENYPIDNNLDNEVIENSGPSNRNFDKSKTSNLSQWFQKKENYSEIDQPVEKNEEYVDYGEDYNFNNRPSRDMFYDEPNKKFSKRINNKSQFDRASGKTIPLENKNWIFYFITKRNKQIFLFFIFLFFCLLILTTLFTWYLSKHIIFAKYWYLTTIFGWVSIIVFGLSLFSYLFGLIIFWKREILHHFFIKNGNNFNKHYHIFLYNFKNFKSLFNFAILIIFVNILVFVTNWTFNNYILKHIVTLPSNSFDVISKLSLSYYILIGVLVFIFLSLFLLRFFLLSGVKFYSTFYNLDPWELQRDSIYKKPSRSPFYQPNKNTVPTPPPFKYPERGDKQSEERPKKSYWTNN